MKVTEVELSFGEVNFLTVGVQGVSTESRYLIKTMIGLDADNIVSKFYGFSKTSKRRNYSFSLPSREIIMRIVLNPDYSNNETVSEIRDRLYRTIAADRSGIITLLFKANGASIANISGFISKFEVPHFSKEPELQITITCDDPMLRAIGPVEHDAADLPSVPNFILTDTVSTAPHGFELGVTFSAITTSFVMRDQETNPEWDFVITPDTAFAVGDSLRLSSIFGERLVELDLVGGGDPVPMVDKVQPGSYWPLIFPGSNDYWIEDFDTNYTWDYIHYHPTYWGV